MQNPGRAVYLSPGRVTWPPPEADPHLLARHCNTRGGPRPTRPWPAGVEEERSYDPWKTKLFKTGREKKKKKKEKPTTAGNLSSCVILPLPEPPTQ